MSRRRQVETIYRGQRIQLDVLRWAAEGGEMIVREVVRHPGAVLIIPVLSPKARTGAEPSLVLIRNDRFAVEQRLWEFPAGALEPGEDPAQAARRECEEETGYRPERIIRLGEFFTSPGFTDERMHVYLAEDPPLHRQALEPHEDITVETRPLSQVLRMIDGGLIRDGKTIAGLLLYQRHVAAPPVKRAAMVETEAAQGGVE